MELKPGMFVFWKDGDVYEIERYHKPANLYKLKNNTYAVFACDITPITKIKIRLSDDMELRKKQSEAIQLKAFSHDVKWKAHGKKTMFTNKQEIFIRYDTGYLWVQCEEKGYIEFTPEQYIGEEIEKPEDGLPVKMIKEIAEAWAGNNDIDIDFRVIPRDWLPAEVHQDHELNRRLVLDTLGVEEYKTQQYQCPYCKYTNSKEKVNDHCKKEHKETIGMSSALWSQFRYEEKIETPEKEG